MGGTVLVAGATGNTGRALVRELKKAGATVRAAARQRNRLLALEASEIAEIDYDDPQTLARAMRGVSKVYMAAPLAPDLEAVTEQMVTAAVRAGASHFVKLSGLGASRPEALQLGFWHRAAERVIESSGLSWTHLRPNAFMQNFIHNHLGSMRSLALFHDPVGEGRVSYIDAEDVAATAARVLTEPGHHNRIYSLTGPEALTGREVARLFSQAAGKDIRCVEVSVDAARDAMFGFGLPVVVVDAVAEWYRHMRDGHLAELSPTVLDITNRPPRRFADFVAGRDGLFR
ncbi:MAG: SDR family oxidoreductase [Rhodospirillaceae bacterium]